MSLETGSQNVPLALGIILIRFPAEVQPEIMIVPILYGVTYRAYGLVVSTNSS